MKKSDIGFAAALALAAAVLYLPTLSYDFMAWDDHAYVAGNPLIRLQGAGSVAALFSTYYRANYAPLHLLAYAGVYGAAGASPWAFHALNVLLHALCTVLVFIFLRRVSLPVSAAALGAAIFLAHPAQVEAVAWVSQAKTLLATAFGLGALLALLGFRERRAAGGGGAWYAAAVILFLGAVLSKAQAIAFPGIYLCVDRALGDRTRRLPPGHWIPFALIAAAGAWAGILAQSSIEAVKPYGPLGPLGSVLGSAGIVLAYLRTILLPVNLSVLHAGEPLARLWDPRLARDLLLFGALVIAAWRLRAGALRPWHALGAFLAPLVPVLGWVPLNVAMADRYLYPAMIGVAWFAGGAAARRGGWGRRALWLLPVCLALLTTARMPVWRDGASLWDAEIRSHPDSLRAWTSRSGYRYRKGNLAGAEADLRQALALDGESEDAWTNLGVVLNAGGKTDEAMAAWRRALAINPEADGNGWYGADFSWGDWRLDITDSSFDNNSW
ncbi:MAG: tetratricopeptide repeat protein, partial [Myxococcota bacterium]